METFCNIEVIAQKIQSNQDGPANLTDRNAAEAIRFHRTLPSYQPTKLVSLSGLATKLGVKGIYVKNEATRFGLKAFKGLGGTYAMFRILCVKLGLNPQQTSFQDFQKADIKSKVAEITFVTATDGNHGKGVSWAAGLFGCQVYVFMPAGSSPEREKAISSVGPAIVCITDKNYDETVAHAKKLSEKNDWVLIQDTAWDGYEQIPLWIIQGYLTMATETVDQFKEIAVEPTHVFLQAGVGAMAGGVCGYLMNHYKNKRPVISIVEPEAAACIFLSAQKADGKAHSVIGNPHTIMAGLNCGTPCKITWPILRDFASAYFSCPDYVAAHGMRTYAKPIATDQAIIAGESGAPTMGLIRLLLEEVGMKKVKTMLGLNKESVILLFNTEGDTDPVNYKNVVENDLYQISK